MEQIFDFMGNHPWMVTSFILLLVWFFMSGSGAGRGFTEVDPNAAAALTNHEKTLVLDIRDDKEYSDGHIVNAMHIPLSELDSKLSKLEKYKDKAIIAYCRSGHRSRAACMKLHKAGFTSLYNLRGGIMAWQRDKMPVKRG